MTVLLHFLFVVSTSVTWLSRFPPTPQTWGSEIDSSLTPDTSDITLCKSWCENYESCNGVLFYSIEQTCKYYSDYDCSHHNNLRSSQNMIWYFISERSNCPIGCVDWDSLCQTEVAVYHCDNPTFNLQVVCKRLCNVCTDGPTLAPWYSPIQSPSTYPSSSIPSLHPSALPTLFPSFNPTFSGPSRNPSISPVLSPSISFPSDPPVFSKPPTNLPISPSLQPSTFLPSSVPTKFPSNLPSSESAMAVKETVVQASENVEDHFGSYLVLVLVFVILLCSIILFCGLFCHHKQIAKMRDQIDHMEGAFDVVRGRESPRMEISEIGSYNDELSSHFVIWGSSPRKTAILGEQSFEQSKTISDDNQLLPNIYESPGRTEGSTLFELEVIEDFPPVDFNITTTKFGEDFEVAGGELCP